MKLITLIRHAEAEKQKKDNYDFERALTTQGRVDAKLMAKSIMKEPGFNPDLIMSSMAFRAIGTARIIASRAGIDKEKVLSHEQLYSDISLENFMKIVLNFPEDAHQVVMVGHNPWIEKIIALLLPEFNFMIPKCGAISLRFDVLAWKEVGKEKTIFNFFKFLRKADDLSQINRLFAKNAVVKIVNEVGTVVDKGLRLVTGMKKTKIMKQTKKLVQKQIVKSGVLTVRTVSELKERAQEVDLRLTQKAQKKEKKLKEKQLRADKKREKEKRRLLEKKANKAKKKLKKKEKKERKLEKRKVNKVESLKKKKNEKKSFQNEEIGLV